MKHPISAAATAAALLIAPCVGGCGAADPPAAGGPVLDTLVEGSAFHGIHGLTFDADDRLYAGSVVGQAIYSVDTESGEVEVWKGPPDGMADDLEFGPDGSLVWTGFLLGTVHIQGPDGAMRTIAEGLPGANSVAFKQDGRLFMTQVFLGDALWELDPRGDTPPRQVLDAPGGLNGFDFGPDGALYGPLWFGQRVVRVDVDSGEMTTVADGFATPAAVNFDSLGNLWALDTARGEVVRIDPQSGTREVVARVATSLDNLAIDSHDRLFVSNMADNAVLEIDTTNGRARTVVEGRLAMPGGLALAADDGTLWVADIFALRSIDTATGAVTDLARMHADELEYPDNVAVDDDSIWASSVTQGAIQRIDRSSGESLGMRHDIAAPTAVLATGGGDIVVTQAGGTLVRTNGLEGEVTVIARDLGLPVGLVDAGDGKVWVSEAAAGRITEIDLGDGSRREVATGLSQPEGMAKAPDGTLVVAEVGLRSLLRIDPQTGSRQVLADGLALGLPAPVGLPPTFIPTGVVVAADGTVYFSSDLDNAVYRLRP